MRIRNKEANRFVCKSINTAENALRCVLTLTKERCWTLVISKQPYRNYELSSLRTSAFKISAAAKQRKETKLSA